MTKTDLDVSVGADIFKTFKKYDYSVSSSIAEFIDNSTASIVNNINFYKNNKVKSFVFIVFNHDEKCVEVFDNGFGIDENDRLRVFKLNKPPKNTMGRNEFGMGLKNAGFWWGNRIEIATKSINENGYYYLDFDIRNLNDNDGVIKADAYVLEITKEKWLSYFNKYNVPVIDHSNNTHGTYLKIDSTNKMFTKKSITKTVNDIASYYNEDINNGVDDVYEKIEFKIVLLKNNIFYDYAFTQDVNTKEKCLRKCEKVYSDFRNKFDSLPVLQKQDIASKVDPIISKIQKLIERSESEYREINRQLETLTSKWDLLDDSEYDVTFSSIEKNYNTIEKLLPYKADFSRLELFKNELEKYKIDQSKYLDGKFKVNVDFDFYDQKDNIYHANGFFGILSSDFTGRENAGIKLYRRGRLIREGEKDFYKPKLIFKDASSFEYQRIYGELHVDNLPASQSKTKFDWDEETKENFNIALLEKIKEPICSICGKLSYRVPSKPYSYNKKNKEIIKTNIEHLLRKDVSISNVFINNEEVWHILVSKDNVSNYHFFYKISEFENNESNDWIRVKNIDSNKEKINGLNDKSFNQNDELILIEIDNRSEWLNPLNDNEHAMNRIIELLTYILTKTIVFACDLQSLTSSRDLVFELVEILNKRELKYEDITNK